MNEATAASSDTEFEEAPSGSAFDDGASEQTNVDSLQAQEDKDEPSDLHQASGHRDDSESDSESDSDCDSDSGGVLLCPQMTTLCIRTKDGAQTKDS
jgi:hypothetical protein